MRPPAIRGTLPTHAEARLQTSTLQTSTPASTAPSPIAQAAIKLAVDLLQDPRTRDAVYQLADDTRRHVASGVVKVTPALVRAVESFAKRKTGCTCGQQHKGAAHTTHRMRTLAAVRGAEGEGEERMEEAIASGSRKSDPATMWRFLSEKLYAEGDAPVLAVREALQNSADAISELGKQGKIKSGEGYFSVWWDNGTLTIEDNGIGLADASFRPTAARPLSARLDAFLTLGGSVKAEGSFGGLGVAKAIILGTGQAGWVVQSGWVTLRAPSRDPNAEYDVEQSSSFHQGTKITLLGVKTRERGSPYTVGNWANVGQRIYGLLELNKLPGIEITLNGKVVPYKYDGYRSISNPEWSALKWTEHQLPNGRPICEGTVRSYERDGGGQARIIYRLRWRTDWGEAWLVQHAQVVYTDIPRDIFLDLTVRVKPKDPNYPLRGSRDGFVDETAIESLREIERDLASEERRKAMVEKEQKEKAEWEDIHPDSTDPDEVRGARAVDDAIETGLEGLQDELDEILKDIRKYAQDPNQYGSGDGGADEGEEGEEGVAIETPDEHSAFQEILDLAKEKSGPEDAARVVNALADVAGVTLPVEVQIVLSHMTRGDAPTTEEAVQIIEAVATIDSSLAAEGTVGTATSSWAQAPAVAAVVEAIAAASVEPAAPAIKKAKGAVNPFGNRAFIRISRHVPEAQVKEFKKNFKKYVKLLAIWDSALRIVAHAARQDKAFQPGFILEAGTRGYCCAVAGANGRPRIFVCINPLAWDTYVALYPTRPDLLARYIFEIACHEVAHIEHLGRSEGHGDDWARAREDLGFNAASALPLITKMVSRLLKIKEKKGTRRSAADPKLKAELVKLRGELDIAHQEHAKLNRDVLYYRGLLQNGGGVVHSLLTRLDQHEKVMAFCKWLEGLPEGQRPLGLTADQWRRLIARLRDSPSTALELLSDRGIALVPFVGTPVE